MCRCVLSGFRCDGYPSPPKRDRDSSSDELPDSKPQQATEQDETPQPLSPVKAEHARRDSGESTTAADPCVLALLSPSSPYGNHTEQRSLKFFTDMTAAMVGRSRSAPYFWATLVPQAAWQHPSARNAMMAAATAHEALFTKSSTSSSRPSAEKQTVTYASRAITHLLNEKVPLDVVMLTSATLGILELFKGNWRTACTHVTSGAKLAEQARLDPVNNAYISFYCQAFASALPGVLKWTEGESVIGEAEPNTIVRLSEAIRSLELALASFNDSLPKVDCIEDEVTRSRITTVLMNGKLEVGRLLLLWQDLLAQEIADHPNEFKNIFVSLERIESPWSSVIRELDLFLEEGGCLDVAKFEVAMERTLPFFTLSKSGPNIKMREAAVEIMFFGMQLRRGQVKGEGTCQSSPRASQSPTRPRPFEPHGS